MKQSETKKNIIDIINHYSLSTNIPPQFIEKDIYVVKVLAVLSKINYPNVQLVFSGGTCLSKAYGKIGRFSEDIDFCINTTVPFSRKEKSNFRKFIISELNKSEDFSVIENPITITDESNFFSFGIAYDKNFESSSNLRKNIKIEFKFENLIGQSNVCEITTLLHPYLNDETVQFACINIQEVLANKFSALLWRSYIKDRTKPLYSKENDPTIMRHLYDIATLETEIKTPFFKELVFKFYTKDCNRIGTQNNHSLCEFANIVLNKLKSDKIFKEEYVNFVDSMCYTKDRISFEDAVNSLKNIVDYISE